MSDLINLASYAKKSVKLDKIVSSTLIKALEQKDPIMSVQFNKINEEALLMKVVISSPFLQTIEEDIELPFLKAISVMEAGLVKLEDLEMRMKAFKQYQVKHKYHVTVDEAKYSYNNHVYNEYEEDYDGNYDGDGYEFT